MNQLLNELNGDLIRPLKDPKFFSKVSIVNDLITWPNGFDLEPADLYELGEEESKIASSY